MAAKYDPHHIKYQYEQIKLWSKKFVLQSFQSCLFKPVKWWAVYMFLRYNQIFFGRFWKNTTREFSENLVLVWKQLKTTYEQSRVYENHVTMDENYHHLGKCLKRRIFSTLYSKHFSGKFQRRRSGWASSVWKVLSRSLVWLWCSLLKTSRDVSQKENH